MLHITKMTKVLFIDFDYATFGDATQVENDPTCFFCHKGRPNNVRVAQS